MKSGEVINKIPGLTHNNIYYYEKIGIVVPKKIQQGAYKHKRREFSQEDVRLIKEIWKYQSQGISPQFAFQKIISDKGSLKKYSGTYSIEKIKNRLRNLKRKLKDVEMFSTQGALHLTKDETVDEVMNIIDIAKKKDIEKRRIKTAEAQKLNGEPLLHLFEILENPRELKSNQDAFEEICERMGIEIEDLDLNPKLNGISIKIKNGFYYIFLNKKLGSNRNYTLSHELLHIISKDRLEMHNFLTKQIDSLLKGNTGV